MPGPGTEPVGEEEIRAGMDVLNRGGQMRYRAGMLAQTDQLLARSMNISIGVPGPGLGASFGVAVNDGPDAVEQQAAEFRRVARLYLS